MQPWADTADIQALWRRRIRDDRVWSELKTERTKFIALCREWRDAAVADGWTVEPTYKHESVDRAFRLTRDGYVVQGIARDGDEQTLPTAYLHIWCPRGIAIAPPATYDFAAIRQAEQTCEYCGAHPVPTQRVAFANRACEKCAPVEQANLPARWAE